MNDKDFRDICAMFALITGATPEEAYAIADAMLEARKPKEAGITAIKRKVRTKC
jgi:hypothetical protein